MAYTKRYEKPESREVTKKKRGENDGQWCIAAFRIEEYQSF